MFIYSTERSAHNVHAYDKQSAIILIGRMGEGQLDTPIPHEKLIWHKVLVEEREREISTFSVDEGTHYATKTPPV